MKYLGIKGGKLIESFTFLPGISLAWMTIDGKTYYDLQFSWFSWYFTIGEIRKKAQEAFH